jgi:transcriptional regulator with XRE-family HTH domain
MPDQPVFGRRLKQLRTERGLTLAALAGEGLSAGYLSRLESGARQPTERAVAHLAAQLGITPDELTRSVSTTLAQSLTLATGLDRDEAGRTLSTALEASAGEDPLLRWQALWQIAEWRRWQQSHEEQRAVLEELVALSTTTELPELQARALAELSRCLRDTGEVTEAVDAALRAHELARGAQLPARVRVAALLALVSALIETGRIPDAARYTQELLAAAEDGTPAERAQARWAAANTVARQGDLAGATVLMDEAVQGFDPREDLTMWMRARISAARLDLMVDPPRTRVARQRVEEAQGAFAFAGTRAVEQALLAVRVRIAVAEGKPAEARELLDRLAGFDDLIPYHDRIRLDVLRNRALLLEGERETALAGLRGLAEQAQQSDSMDLAAEIWRLVAESLADQASRTNQAD